MEEMASAGLTISDAVFVRDRPNKRSKCSLGDRVGEVGGPEGGRRGEDRDATGGQRVDRPAVGVETDEGPVVGHVHAVLEPLLERPLHRGDPLGKHVGHRRELHASAAGIEGVDDGAAAAAAAADERRGNLVAAGDVHAPGRDRRRGRRVGLGRRSRGQPPGHRAPSRRRRHG